MPLSYGWQKSLLGSPTASLLLAQMSKARPSGGPDGPSPPRILDGFLPGTARGRSRTTVAAPIGYH